MRNRLLIVSDNLSRIDSIAEMFADDYVIEKATGIDEAVRMLDKIKDETAAVIEDMIDIKGENSDFTLLDAVNKGSLSVCVPVLALCSSAYPALIETVYDRGACDCITQPFSEKIIKTKVERVVKLFRYQDQLEDKIEDQTKKLKMQNNLLRSQAEFLKKSNFQIIDLMGTMAEYRDLESGEHIQRMKTYTKIIAEEMMKEFPEKGLTPEKISVIVSASPLHDIGKIAISDTILLKPGKLTEKEYECMKSHTLYGCEIIEKLKDTWNSEYIKTSMEICRNHHERFDGKGYPDGLKGDEIPLSAQIVSVADVYDVLVHERVYKAAIPEAEAYSMIENGECGVFSPELMRCLTNCRKAMSEAFAA